MLTHEKLLAAFNLFDSDNSGSITIDELMKVFGAQGEDDI
jgi:Ca2+-binding EF-hand superfamily protein